MITRRRFVQLVGAGAAALEDLSYASKAIPEPIPVKRWTVHEVG